MMLEGFGISGLAQSFNGIGVSEEMRVDSLGKASPFGCCFDDLPGPDAVDGEKGVMGFQSLFVSIGLEPFGQAFRAGYLPGFLAFADNLQDRFSFKLADLCRRQRQGFRDA